MRKVTYGGAISLDGFLAGPNEEIDWLSPPSDEARAIMAESFRGIDAMLMGRKTYEFAQAMGGGPPMKGVTTYVFSSSLTQVKDAELVSTDAGEFVREMKRQEGGNILVMGGGELGSALIDAGLVDEIGFSIQPVLLGGGIPAFRELSRRVELELVETRPINPGCVLVRYRIVS